jgi:cob(I)alamin adenosyltransferase
MSNNTPRRKRVKKGLVIVNTGHGKGKSTGAFGIMLRAWGREMNICVIQFIKHENATFGEHRAARKLDIEFISSGDGFTWLSKDLDETEAKAQHGWELAKKKITSEEYDLIVLDEMTYLFKYGWLDVNEAIDWLKANKPERMHLVITGRDAPQELMDYADTVTEMKLVKHPFEAGIKAQAGVDY